ncbi:hypothetical protein GJ629_09790 [Halapricum sp. CBA1109]|uniref:biotin/lipoyl-containing protein n=1 Tax=Halapricum sp. CBA1109 TaxID=2668068 RepID=UPI0012F94A49|nr:biotin/lipoyl-containing protein [Halapricum sp. CBA1109]MUV90143.1 hypothetical protein [Halapricum sp. CBA1109]
MAREYTVPSFDDGSEDGTLVDWHVETGGTVEEGERLVDIETDKSVVEVAAPERMAVTERLATAGDTVAVGDVLLRYDPSAGADTTTDAEDEDDGPQSVVSRVGDEGGEGDTDPTPAVSRVGE